MDSNELTKQTWEHFENIIHGKKIFLFGAGAYADIYFQRYRENLILDGVIDNDLRKQGFCVDEFVAEAFQTSKGKLKISDIAILKQYSSDEMIVVISSMNYYNEIAQQLEKLGICCYFVIFFMERNRTGEKDNRDIALRNKIFAKQCCDNNKIEERKIFFRAYGDYTDHGKYITEALLKIRTDLDIVWAVRDLAVTVPKGVRKIYEGNWKRYIYEMETAKMWVLDLAASPYILKRQGQIYIQTKHWASITLKKFYLDASAFENVPERIEGWKRDGQMIDYIITGSDFDMQSCRRGFGFQGKFLQFGSPRSDTLFHEKKNREKVYQYYGINQKKYSLLYAPTYRFDKKRGKTFHQAKELELDFEQAIRALEERFHGEWYIMLRLHPSVADAFKDVEIPSYVVNVSNYNDSEELASAADVTISDFSSIMFEPAFVKKPVFLFATDLQDYLENEFDLLIPYHELPFPVAQSNEELAKCIRNFDMEKYVNDVSGFLERYGVSEDGHASDRTAEFISSIIEEYVS